MLYNFVCTTARTNLRINITDDYGDNYHRGYDTQPDSSRQPEMVEVRGNMNGLNPRSYKDAMAEGPTERMVEANQKWAQDERDYRRRKENKAVNDKEMWDWMCEGNKVYTEDESKAKRRELAYWDERRRLEEEDTARWCAGYRQRKSDAKQDKIKLRNEEIERKRRKKIDKKEAKRQLKLGKDEANRQKKEGRTCQEQKTETKRDASKNEPGNHNDEDHMWKSVAPSTARKQTLETNAQRGNQFRREAVSTISVDPTRRATSLRITQADLDRMNGVADIQFELTPEDRRRLTNVHFPIDPVMLKERQREEEMRRNTKKREIAREWERPHVEPCYKEDMEAMATPPFPHEIYSGVRPAPTPIPHVMSRLCESLIRPHTGFTNASLLPGNPENAQDQPLAQPQAMSTTAIIEDVRDNLTHAEVAQSAHDNAAYADNSGRPDVSAQHATGGGQTLSSVIPGTYSDTPSQIPPSLEQECVALIHESGICCDKKSKAYRKHLDCSRGKALLEQVRKINATIDDLGKRKTWEKVLKVVDRKNFTRGHPPRMAWICRENYSVRTTMRRWLEEAHGIAPVRIHMALLSPTRGQGMETPLTTYELDHGHASKPLIGTSADCVTPSLDECSEVNKAECQRAEGRSHTVRSAGSEGKNEHGCRLQN